MRILFLDDDRIRHLKFKSLLRGFKHTIDYVYDAKSCIELLNSNTYDMVFLDHDLGGEIYVTKTENTGYEVALYIANELYGTNIPDIIIIHSYNPAGVERMVGCLTDVVDSNIITTPFISEHFLSIVELINNTQ